MNAALAPPLPIPSRLPGVGSVGRGRSASCHIAMPGPTFAHLRGDFMSKKTRATEMLEKKGITFSVHTYDYDPDADRIGMQAAEALGEPPQRVLKTLMA